MIKQLIKIMIRNKRKVEEKKMLVKTRYFGEIDLTEDKIVTFEQGIMGFEEYKKYTILYDSDEEKK